MIAALAVALVMCVPQGMADAITRARAGDMVGAWSAAAAETDPLKAQQARVWVSQHAGDLERALDEALRGVTDHPGDAWLAERATAIAVSLRRANAAEFALARLDAALTSNSSGGNEAFAEAAQLLRPEVTALAQRAASRTAADRRAHVTVFGVGALALCALLWLARRA